MFTYSTDDEDGRVFASNLLTSLDALFHGLNEEILVGVRDLTGKRSTVGVSQLPGPVFHSQCRTGVTSREAKGSDTAANFIGKELQVKEKTIATVPAAQDVLPATLLLVAVGESDVDVLQGEVLLGQLLETQDNSILGSILHP
jgi:hypothetical protein